MYFKIFWNTICLKTFCNFSKTWLKSPTHRWGLSRRSRLARTYWSGRKVSRPHVHGRIFVCVCVDASYLLPRKSSSIGCHIPVQNLQFCTENSACIVYYLLVIVNMQQRISKGRRVNLFIWFESHVLVNITQRVAISGQLVPVSSAKKNLFAPEAVRALKFTWKQSRLSPGATHLHENTWLSKPMILFSRTPCIDPI